MSTDAQPITVLDVYTTFAWVQPVGSGGVNLAVTDARYLQKTVPDTATALETFDAGIKTNSIALVSGTTLSLPAATTTAPATGDTGSSRVVTSQWVRDQGYLTATTGNVTYNGVGPFTTIQSFSANIKTDSVQPYLTGGNVNINSAVADSPPIPDDTTRVPNTNWVNTTITNALNATTLFAKLAGTAVFTALQTFNLGIKTNSIVLVSGSTLSLPAATTTAPVGGDSSSRVVTSQWVTNEAYAKTAIANIWSLLQTFSSGIKTDTISLNIASTLSLPAATTTAPATSDPGSSRVVTSQWVRDQNYSSAAGYVTYSGVGPFTTLQTFDAGIKTDSIIGSFTNSYIDIGTNQTPGGEIRLGSSNSIVKTAGTLTSLTTSGILSIGTDQTAGGLIQLGSSNSIIKTAGILTSLTTSGTLSIGTDQIASGIMNLGSAFTTMTMNALRYVIKVGVSGSGIVEFPIGNNPSGNSALSITVSKKSEVSTSDLNVFNIKSLPIVIDSFTQYGEIVTSGVNKTLSSDVYYTQKVSFIIRNNGGTVQMISATTDKNYTSSGMSIVTSFNSIGFDELRIGITTPTSFGKVSQHYISTLTMYPCITSTGNRNFIIEAM